MIPFGFVTHWFHRLCGGASLALSLLCPSSMLLAAPPEPHSAALTAQIVETCRVLREREPDARLLAVWDFDGTLLKGDCSEGLEENGQQVYPGLAELCIGAGLARDYRGEGALARFWRDYRDLDSRIGHWLAYPYLPQILAGSTPEEVTALARRHFSTTYRPYLFSSSISVFRELQKAGVENHVISASAHVFVQGATELLGLPASQIHGIQVRVIGGKLTRDLIYPVTYAEGKRELLQTLARSSYPKPTYIVAAFGNSYSTDGAFLHYVADLTLPAGETTVVMINGGEPKTPPHPRILRVTQSATVD